MFSFLISSFFLTLRTRLRFFKVSCISLQKILIDEMSLSDCITFLTAFAQMESKRKRFGFLKERFIGSPRLNTWTFTTCK